MDITRKIFVVSALICSAAWLVKMPVIAATGGADSDGPVIAVLWALGALGLVVAGGSGAAVLAARAPIWARVLVGIVAAPLAFVAMTVLDGVIKEAYTIDGWFADEAALVVIAVVLGALAIRTLLGRQAARSAAVPT